MPSIRCRAVPFFCLLFLLKTVLISAQNSSQNTDSLLAQARVIYDKTPKAGINAAEHVYKSAQSKKDQLAIIKAANFIAQLYWEARSTDTAKMYIGYALQANKNIKADSLHAESWMVLGMIDHTAGLYKNAIGEYARAVAYYRAAGKTSDMAKSYLNSGMCQIQLSEYDNAIKNCLQAVAVFEGLKEHKNAANGYKAIASCFLHLSDYKRAIAYNKKALAIRLSLKDTSAIAQSLNNTGNAFREAKQPDSAIAYLSRCLLLRKNEKDSSKLVLTLQNIGSAYRQKGNNAEAKKYIQRSVNIAGGLGMKEELALGSLDMAQIYLAEGQTAMALAAANLSQATAAALNLPELLKDAYGTKAEAYLQMGNYKEALTNEKLRNALNDSIFTIAKNKTINELDVKYQTVQKEKDIDALRAQNRLQDDVVSQQRKSILALIAAALLLIILVAAVYNNYRIKHRASQRIQVLMRELHHRVKNNLQILSGLFAMQIAELTDEKARDTLRENETRLASMNLVHNILYQESNDTRIQMSEYLTKLLQHIKESFGEDTNDTITLRTEIADMELDADKAVAVGLIVNELATNAFKYAFNGKSGEVYLSLQYAGKTKAELKLHDNGLGIPEANKNKELSFGLKLVNLMARQLQTSLHVESGQGTRYQMEITL